MRCRHRNPTPRFRGSVFWVLGGLRACSDVVSEKEEELRCGFSSSDLVFLPCSILLGSYWLIIASLDFFSCLYPLIYDSFTSSRL